MSSPRAKCTAPVTQLTHALPCPQPQVIRYSHNGKSKGYGFVSFGDQIEGVRVIKEMNGKYVGEYCQCGLAGVVRVGCLDGRCCIPAGEGGRVLRQG